MCVNSGPEFQSDFTVQIDAVGTPVSGVNVEIGDGRNLRGGVEFEPLRMTVKVTGGLPPSSLHFAHRAGSGGPGCGSGPALYLTRASN